MNKSNFEYDEFFQDLVDQVVEIMSELDPNGILRIPQYIITKLGYPDKQALEEEILYKVYKVYKKVAIFIGTDSETIIEKMRKRTVII